MATSDEEMPDADPGTEEATAPRTFLREARGEAYLRGFATPARVSNSHFSAKVEQPFSRDSLRAALSRNAKETEDIHATCLKLYEPRFEDWLVELQAGFSLIFYGPGSKRAMLDHFCTTLTGKGTVMIVKGYSPDSSIAQILSTLESHLTVDSKGVATFLASGYERNEARALAILHHLTHASHSEQIFICLHSWDALPHLRSAKVKSVLARLAAFPRIHFLASLDHVRSMLLFDASLTSTTPLDMTEEPVEYDRGFAFLHHYTPTFASFSEELLAGDILATLFAPEVFPPTKGAKGDVSSASRIEGTFQILRQVNENSRKVFQTLANRQLAAYENEVGIITSEQISHATHASTPAIAVPLGWLYDKAQQDMTVSSRGALDQILKEWTDHKTIIRVSEPPEGVEADDQSSEWLWITLDKKALTGLLKRVDDMTVPLVVSRSFASHLLTGWHS